MYCVGDPIFREREYRDISTVRNAIVGRPLLGYSSHQPVGFSLRYSPNPVRGELEAKLQVGALTSCLHTGHWGLSRPSAEPSSLITHTSLRVRIEVPRVRQGTSLMLIFGLSAMQMLLLRCNPR